MRSVKAVKAHKRVNYSRRAQRRRRAQKREREGQRLMLAQSVLDREDRKIGTSKRQWERVTLSQLILPKPSHSG